MQEEQMIINAQEEEKKQKKQSSNKIDANIWSILLITTGMYFLLREFNIINEQVIDAAVKSWPLLLIWLGVHNATKNNPKVRTIAMVIIISLFVFILLHSINFKLPQLR